MKLLSLILATCGRKDEVCRFIESVLQSVNVSVDDIEIIVVDQNSPDFNLKREVLKFSELISIKYIHSSKRGLSLSRNLGLNIASGKYLAFPDDDCLYYQDTIQSIISTLDNELGYDFIIGRIYDRNTQKNILKYWPARDKVLTKWNFYFLSSSITMFFKNKSVTKFDEQLGLGANYGSCEDPDYILNNLNVGSKGLYTTRISVWHPEVPDTRFDSNRVRGYLRGFGFFCRKNLSAPIILFMFGSVVKRLLLTIVSKDVNKVPVLKSHFKGLYEGFMKK